MNQDWLLAAAAFLSTLVILRVLQLILIRRLSRVDLAVEVLKRTKFYFIFSLALYGALFLLKLPEFADRLVHHGVLLVTLLQVAIWGSACITFSIQHYMRRKGGEDAAIATTVGLIGLLARMVFYVLIVLFALNNFGVNITAVVAGLGVGGIAIALAVQNILSDLFASLTIVLDKPFVVGDFITVDQFSGTIERIGLKTTRIRSLSGEQIIFANAGLLQSRIRNFKRMRERRVAFTIGLVYQTPLEKLKRATQILKEVIQSQKAVRFERSHFMNFGTSSLDVETVYWIESSDYAQYMDLHQAILLEVYRRFEQESLSFAYPKA